jgi:signal transduction histidine kinase
MLITEEAWQDVGNASLQTTQTIPLILIPVLVIAILGLLILIRWVLQPLQKLASQTKQMDETRLVSLGEPVGGIQEISNLQAALLSLYTRWMDARHNLQEYIGGLTASVEAERKELARELHDGLLQDLIAIKQDLHSNPTDVKKAEKIQDLIDQVRGFTRGLRPPYLEDLGWVTAVRTLIVEYQEILNIPISLKISGEEIRLIPDVELTLFRVVQEAFVNIRKHASAQKVEISIQFLPEQLELLIHDDGQGFTLPERLDQLAAAGHYGLLGMKERIELAQGTLAISTAPGKGTSVLVQVPLDFI